eukprot:PITA_04914
MQSGKAPGPDGFNVNFFKACWETVKYHILEVVEDSRRSKKVLKALNASFIALIPKQENSMTPDGFRPIALCNVVYKIISKVITNRPKPLLPSLISEEQTGYVEGRKILNNIIQAHEVVQSLKNNKQDGMIIQLGLVKAYDKLSWACIREILKAYGFDQNWIRWVVDLVTSTSFSILLNGAPSRTFTPSRGLRQGDPLSPLLFILMMEGLGRVIIMANAKGRIQGIKLTANGEANTHQKFVDDTMLGEEKKKWALVAWDKICKPKSHGGLGLHDPKTLNKVFGANLWWRWIQEPNSPWAKLWKQKYAKYWKEKDRIRMSGQIKGSHIWNLAWDNKNIVQHHRFWEIRTGDLARFWEDN